MNARPRCAGISVAIIARYAAMLSTKEAPLSEGIKLTGYTSHITAITSRDGTSGQRDSLVAVIRSGR